MKHGIWLAGLFLLVMECFGSARVLPIPRTAVQDFRTEGLFEGGSSRPANLESLHFSEQEGFERWEVDFSDSAKREIGKIAPVFQVRYIPGNKILGPDGIPIVASPPKFILTFQSIRKNYLQTGALQEIVKKSKHVKDIIVYPPVDEGDTAIEIILNNDVTFKPYQPSHREGRLVLELK